MLKNEMKKYRSNKFVGFLFLVVFLVFVFSAKNANAATQTYYITQSGAGLQDGTSLANAWSAVNFNDTANWSSTENTAKIDPGDTAILSGTFTSQLTVRQSGTSGNPITINGTDAVVNVGGGAQYGLLLSRKNYINITGGTYKNATVANIYVAQSNNVFISYANFTDVGTGVKLYAGDGYDLKDVTIATSTFSDLSIHGILGEVYGGTTGGELGIVHDVYILGNTMTNIATSSNGMGIQIWGPTATLYPNGDKTGTLRAPYNIKIEGNTINNTRKSAIGLTEGCLNSGWGTIIRNNRVTYAGQSDVGNINAFQLNSCDNLLVEGNEISYTETSVTDGIGIILDWGNSDNDLLTDGAIVRNNFIHNNTAQSWGTGISAYKTTNSRIYNNISISNNVGIIFSNPQSSGNEFYNNVMYGNGPALYTAGGARIDSVAPSSVWKNNVFMNNNPYGIYVATSGTVNPTESYNVFYGNTSGNIYNNNTASAVSLSATDLTSNPSFSNGTTGTYSTSTDFILSANSPAIDSGVNVSLTTDYTGNSIYGVPDIGAYEYQPPYTFSSYNIPTTGSIRLYSDGKYRTTIATTSSSSGSFSVAPVGGYYTASTSQYMDITIDTWETTGNKNKQWTATSTAGSFLTQATSTVYTIGDLAPGAYYSFKLDGSASTTAVTGSSCTNGICLSDSSGNLTITYVGGYSTHTFGLEKDTSGPSAFSPSSPINNTNASDARLTLSWNATSDSESGLNKYQLYIDNVLDTDNISANATSATMTGILACGAHTWFVRAVDNNGNTTDSNTFNYTVTCSGSGGRSIRIVNQTTTSSSSSSSDNSQQNNLSPTVLSESNQTPSTLFHFSKKLSYGSKGNEVSELQKRLMSENVYAGPVTGYFGLMTIKAVKKYQAKNNLPQVGVVGFMTISSLNGSPLSLASTSSGLSLIQFIDLLISLGVISSDKAELAKTASILIKN